MNKLLSKNFIIGVIFISISLMFIFIAFFRSFIDSEDNVQILADSPEKAVSLFINYARRGDEKNVKRLLIEAPHQYYIEYPKTVSTKDDSNQTEGIYTRDLPFSSEQTGEVKHKASLYRRIKAYINPEPFENSITESKYYMDVEFFSDIELLWRKARIIYISGGSFKTTESNITNDEASIKIKDNFLKHEDYYYLKKTGEEWKVFSWEPESFVDKNRFIYGKARNCSNR